MKEVVLRSAATMVALAAIVLLPSPAQAAVDELAMVTQQAFAQIGKPFRMGTEGPSRFDCSGLVYYVFSQAGLLDRIGGKRLVAREYYNWARERGLLAKTGPRVGDLILWGNPGSGGIKHMGIYIGQNARGKPMAISALTTGVARHHVDRISISFFSYIHVGLSVVEDPPPPPPPPSASPTSSPTATPSPSPTSSPSATGTLQPSPDPTSSPAQ